MICNYSFASGNENDCQLHFCRREKYLTSGRRILRLSLCFSAPDDIGAQQDYIRIKATGKGAKCPEN